jgi:hypothetical protein
MWLIALSRLGFFSAGNVSPSITLDSADREDDDFGD